MALRRRGARGVREMGRFAAALVTVAVTAGACNVPTQPPDVLPAGYDTFSGGRRVWPARGSLAGDASAVAAVGTAIAGWRTSTDDRARLAASGILWLGVVDGVRLGAVAATVPGDGSTWLVQVVGDGPRFHVKRAERYPDTGLLPYADVLPLLTPAGRRYLASTRVVRVLGPDGAEVPVSDGITAVVPVERCAAAPVTVVWQSASPAPAGPQTTRLVELGTGAPQPRWPLVADDARGSAVAALAGLDTCRLRTGTGAWTTVVTGAVRPKPTSAWPIRGLRARRLVELPPGAGGGILEQLFWTAEAGQLTAVIYRPTAGASVVSGAEQRAALQAYALPIPGRPLAVVAWRADAEARLTLPGVTPLVERPGLVVVPKAGTQTFTLTVDGKVVRRTL